MSSIRLATVDDAEQILLIYSPYITDTVITFEYDVPTVADMQQRITDILKKFPWLVFEDDREGILGYAYATPFRTRVAYTWTVETAIYVKLGHHSRGQNFLSLSLDNNEMI